MNQSLFDSCLCPKFEFAIGITIGQIESLKLDDGLDHQRCHDAAKITAQNEPNTIPQFGYQSGVQIEERPVGIA